MNLNLFHTVTEYDLTIVVRRGMSIVQGGRRAVSGVARPEGVEG
jgi:hypothetical protein